MLKKDKRRQLQLRYGLAELEFSFDGGAVVPRVGALGRRASDALFDGCRPGPVRALRSTAGIAGGWIRRRAIHARLLAIFRVLFVPQARIRLRRPP